ncbi:hypothetical protein [Anaerovibrio lipolyticus]|uniref:hypothetical protein n=1 Tax=Anaerovibrio lipolyticus TaxID=82374 RepID=UPI000480CAD6|nr:hypothetical protein [Anaerovibrio lipolyticus]
MMIIPDYIFGLTRSEIITEVIMKSGIQDRRYMENYERYVRWQIEDNLNLFGLTDCEEPEYSKIQWDKLPFQFPPIEQLKGLTSEEVIDKLERCNEESDVSCPYIGRIEKIFLKELGLWDEKLSKNSYNSWLYSFTRRYRLFPKINELEGMTRDEAITEIRRGIRHYCDHYELILDEIFIINSYLTELGFPPDQLLQKKSLTDETIDYCKMLIPTLTDERAKNMAKEIIS